MNQFTNPYLNPYGMNQFGQIQPSMLMQQAQPQQVTRVNGRNGATQYQMGANSSALLLDESGTMVWLATTDGAGYKTVTPYDISPHQDAPVPNYGDLEDRVKRLEEMMNGTARNTNATRKKQPEDGTD